MHFSKLNYLGIIDFLEYLPPIITIEPIADDANLFEEALLGTRYRNC